MSVRARLLRAPALRTEETGRSSSWLELFFDLVFVIAITQIGLALAGDVSLCGFARFALLLAPVWWSWVGYTNYADRFDSDDLPFRLLMLGGMAGIAVVAVAIPDAFGHRSAVFAGAYAVVRTLLILLYARARRHVPAARALCNVTMSVFIVGTTLWVISIAVPEPWRFLLWGAALGIEGATPWIARRAMTAVPYHASHLPERYGLFTLIVLGEALAAVAFGVHRTNWQAESIIVAGAAFVCAAALWWVYFDSIDRGIVRQSLLARNVFIYGHLAIAMGLTMLGVGIKQAILYANTGHLPAGDRWALCGGAALFLGALAIVRGVATHAVHDEVLAARTAIASLLAVCGVVGTWLSRLALMLIVCTLLLAAVVIDVSLHLRMEAAPELGPGSSDAQLPRGDTVLAAETAARGQSGSTS